MADRKNTHLHKTRCYNYLENIGKGPFCSGFAGFAGFKLMETFPMSNGFFPKHVIFNKIWKSIPPEKDRWRNTRESWSPEALCLKWISSWWLNQPIWKTLIYESNWKSSPGRGENKKYLKPPTSIPKTGFKWCFEMNEHLCVLASLPTKILKKMQYHTTTDLHCWWFRNPAFTSLRLVVYPTNSEWKHIYPYAPWDWNIWSTWKGLKWSADHFRPLVSRPLGVYHSRP